MSPRQKAICVLLLLSGWSAAAAARSATNPEKTNVIDGHVTHDVGLMWNNVTNFGLIGSLPSATLPLSAAPSARWPGETGLNHLWAAGLWVGGKVLGETRVLTAAGAGVAGDFSSSEAAADTIYATFQGDTGGNRYPWPDPDDDQDGAEDEDPQNGRDDDGDGLVDEDFAAVGNQHFRCK